MRPLRECEWTQEEIAIVDFITKETRRTFGELFAEER